MTAVPTDPRFTDCTAATDAEFQARIGPIEAAEEAPEALRERVAEALYRRDGGQTPWSETWGVIRGEYLALADAALDVLRPADVAGDSAEGAS